MCRAALGFWRCAFGPKVPLSAPVVPSVRRPVLHRPEAVRPSERPRPMVPSTTQVSRHPAPERRTPESTCCLSAVRCARRPRSPIHADVGSPSAKGAICENSRIRGAPSRGRRSAVVLLNSSLCFRPYVSQPIRLHSAAKDTQQSVDVNALSLLEIGKHWEALKMDKQNYRHLRAKIKHYYLAVFNSNT